MVPQSCSLFKLIGPSDCLADIPGRPHTKATTEHKLGIWSSNLFLGEPPPKLEQLDWLEDDSLSQSTSVNPLNILKTKKTMTKYKKKPSHAHKTETGKLTCHIKNTDCSQAALEHPG